MSKYMVEIGWDEAHTGHVEVEAENEDEAMNKVEMNFSDYQEQLLGEDTFIAQHREEVFEAEEE